METFKLTE